MDFGKVCTYYDIISVTESRNVSAVKLYVRRSSRCWSSRSPGQTFQAWFPVISIRLSETHCHIVLVSDFWVETYNFSIYPGFQWTLIRSAAAASPSQVITVYIRLLYD